MNLIKSIKEAEEDFEWYPTTEEIMRDVARVVDKLSSSVSHFRYSGVTVVDPCAGDGRFLNHVASYVRADRQFGIEKSAVLRGRWESIRFAGVDYMQCSLIDVAPDVVVCNPPYSEYEVWLEKVLNEVGPKTLCAFVLPTRWTDTKIGERVRQEHKVTSVGFYDFAQADRGARAKVEAFVVVAHPDNKSSAFSRFFQSNFQFDETDYEHIELKEEDANEVGRKMNFVESLVASYESRIKRLAEAVRQVAKIPRDVRAALELSTDQVERVVRQKLESSKSHYWKALFDEAREITNRLTSKSRTKLLHELHMVGAVDFNADNAYAVLLDVVNKANLFTDEQIVHLFERMADVANVVNYKSNHKVYVRDKFRYYSYDDDEMSHVRLGDRLVMENAGGLDVCPYSKGPASTRSRGLSGQAADFLSDILTVAYTLNMQVTHDSIYPDPNKWERPRMFDKWEGNNATFYLRDDSEFMHVRVFLNGNMHIKFNPAFVHRLSVRHGILKGWLRHDDDAVAEELQISKSEAVSALANHNHISHKLLLC